MDIKQNPLSSADSMYQIRSNQKESQAPLVQVNTAGSPLQVETSIAGLTVAIYHHRGDPFYWIIVPPVAKLAFEAKIRAEFREEIGDGECSRFVNHLSLWITPDRLKTWNIDFFQITQGAGQLLFLFPGTYFWGWSRGHNILEMKNHTGPEWNCGDYKFCSLMNKLCYEANKGQPGLYLQPKDASGKFQRSCLYLRNFLLTYIPSKDEDAIGNEGGAMIDPVPRRKRPKKPNATSPFEHIMDTTPGLSSTANAPSGADGCNPSGSNIPGEEHPPSSEGSLPPPLPHSGKYQLEYLLRVNHDLGKENEELRQQNQTLFETNHSLGNQLHQTSTEREDSLRNQLQEASVQRDGIYSILLERDDTIEFLKAELHESSAPKWNTAALNGYDIVKKRDRRIEELEKLMRDNNNSVPEK